MSDRSGHEGTHELSWSKFCETSVTLCWSGGGCLPDYQQISTLQLHGVRRIALNCPGLKKWDSRRTSPFSLSLSASSLLSVNPTVFFACSVRPGWRSLMANVDMPALTQGAQVIGQDRLVELKLLQPGMIIGVWRVITYTCSYGVLFYEFTFFFLYLKWREFTCNWSDGSPCRNGPRSPLSCSPFTSTDWWNEASRDLPFGRLHFNRHLFIHMPPWRAVYPHQMVRAWSVSATGSCISPP